MNYGFKIIGRDGKIQTNGAWSIFGFDSRQKGMFVSARLHLAGARYEEPANPSEPPYPSISSNGVWTKWANPIIKREIWRYNHRLGYKPLCYIFTAGYLAVTAHGRTQSIEDGSSELWGEWDMLVPVNSPRIFPLLPNISIIDPDNRDAQGIYFSWFFHNPTSDSDESLADVDLGLIPPTYEIEVTDNDIILYESLQSGGEKYRTLNTQYGWDSKQRRTIWPDCTNSEIDLTIYITPYKENA